MAKSTKFYKDILELPIKTKSSEWVEFFTRETTLALHPLKSKRKNIKSKPSSGRALVGFMVSDLESTARTLKEKNVKFHVSRTCTSEWTLAQCRLVNLNNSICPDY